MLIYLWKSHLSKAVWAAFLMLRTLRTISAQFAWEVEPNSEPVKCKACGGSGQRTNALGTHSIKCTDCEGLGN
jgi:DnaJ-class molecular chaperone